MTRTINGRGEVLVVTYTDGTTDRFFDADEVRDNLDHATMAVRGSDRTLAHLVLTNVRKWEWRELS